MRILATVLFCTSAAACAASTDETTTNTTESAFTAAPVTNYPAWGQIQYSVNGECLTEWSTTDESVHTRPCDANDPLQFFQFTPHPTLAGWSWIRGWHNGCLDNPNGDQSSELASHVYQSACSTSATAEGWRIDEIGQLHNSLLNNCAGVIAPFKGPPSTHGVTLGACHSEITWRVIPTSAPRVNRYAFLGLKNRCLDHGPYQPFGAGLPLVTWDCNGGLAQMFQWNPFNHGEIKDLATGLCVDTLFNSWNGAPIVEMPCNGSITQTFTVANGQVVSNWSNKCLEVRGWSESNGTQVELWDCWGGLLQHWDHVQ